MSVLMGRGSKSLYRPSMKHRLGAMAAFGGGRVHGGSLAVIICYFEILGMRSGNIATLCPTGGNFFMSSELGQCPRGK